jgi:insulysin
MLILVANSQQYPVENAYAQYLSAHSGYSNAYTATTSTNYYFEVAAKPVEDGGSSEAERSPLYGALDRFSQFFIEPLFLSSTLDRELRAVDSENKKNLQNDQWRLHQLDKSLSNPKHPYCHFSTGNLDTLKILPEAKGIDIRQAFMQFHEKHYSANRMKLVVLGRESLDTLQEWVADLFVGVKNKNLPGNRWETEQPLGKDELLTQYFAKPVMETRTVELYFPFMDEETLFETQPSRYISHLIGHEGPGSIMAYIKSKGWANGLSAGAYPVCPGTPGLFNCHVRLTEDGMSHYQEIIKIIFQYISLLRETPPQEWIFEEQKGMAEVEFKFKQKTPASKFTSKISAVMQKPLPREFLLSGHSKLRKFDPAAIQEALSYLRPDNFRIAVVSQKFPGDWDQKERWYGTEYKNEKIPEDFLAEIRMAAASNAGERIPELHLPHKNQFIPSKLEVEKKDVKQPAIAPKLIRSDDLIRAWYKKDDTFWVPKANLFISCKNPLPSATAENALKAQVYTDMVKDALEEYVYDAELAGLDYQITGHSMGIEIQVYGYNDKLPVLLEKVLTTMRDLVVRPERFEIVKERLLRGMRNWDYQSPYNQISDFMRWLNVENGFINDELLTELERLTADDVQSFYPHLLRQMHIDTLVHGNLYKEDALRLTNLVENTLKPHPLSQAHLPVRRNLIFPPGCNYLYRRTLKDPKNVNHCIEYSLHVGDRADRVLRNKTLLMDQMTHERAFDQLRTKEQLGYVVWSGIRVAETTIAYRIIIQSEKTPEYLESRIDAFLESYKQTIQDMSESVFEGHKRSLITKRLEKLKNLTQESGRLWSHIDNEYFDFELGKFILRNLNFIANSYTAYHDAAHIQKLTKTDMLEFFLHYIAPSSPVRAKLAIHLHARGVSEVSTPVEKLPAEVSATGVNGTVEKGIDMLKIDSKPAGTTNGVASDAGGPTAPVSEPHLIENIRDFRSRLVMSAGPQPVKDLSEFEELDSKL